MFLAVALVVLMLLPRPAPPPAAPIEGDRLVVVGVGERAELAPVDAQVLDQRSADASYGVVTTDRQVGECVSAAWLSLGADGRALTDQVCEPTLGAGPTPQATTVEQWDDLVRLNEDHGVAIGQLAQAPVSVSELDADRNPCIMAVGRGAALAAADASGEVAAYSEREPWINGGMQTDCAVTLVDARDQADRVIEHFAHRPVTLLVIGMGPDGALQSGGLGVRQTHDEQMTSVQLAYRVNPPGQDGPTGMLTSNTTRESGVVTLHDVARAITNARYETAESSALRTEPHAVSAEDAAAHLRVVANLENREPIIAVFGLAIVALLAGAALSVWRQVWAPAPWIGAAMTTWPLALLAGGIFPWYESPRPVTTGILTMVVAWGAAAAAARALTTGRRPAGIAGAALTLAMTAVSSARGDLWQWGTLLDSTTALGPDWAGIGPGAGAACVGAALTIAAWWADRLNRRHSLMAIAALVLLIGVVLLPNFPYSLALLAGGLVLAFADTARNLVHEAVPWADPLFVGGAVASLVAALTGTALLLVDSGTIFLHAAPETPLFGGILMAWLGSVTLALWLQLRAPEWVLERERTLRSRP